MLGVGGVVESCEIMFLWGHLLFICSLVVTFGVATTLDFVTDRRMNR